MTHVGEDLGASRGFAASAFASSRARGSRAWTTTCDGARDRGRWRVNASGTNAHAGTGEGTRAFKRGVVAFERGYAAEPARAEERDGDDGAVPIQVDLDALDRARAEIDMLHRERQLKSWQKVYASMKGGVAYAGSFGPWLVKLSRMSRGEWKVTISQGWASAKEEMAHYWSGAKLLWVEVKIAAKLSWRLMGGEELSRRERKQLTRTTADVFRLVPFAAFVIIPFLELLLPLTLKIFPNMLPSTFRNELKHEEEMKKQLKAKLEVARFLQDTVKVMAKGLKHSRSGVTRERADDLYMFMKKIRTGASVTNDEILKFSKLFSDEFTLYQVNRAQLVNMCKFVGLAPYGTDTFLRFQLRNKLREIKNDDRLIKLEGLETMTTGELRSAARMRGMRWEEDRESLLAQLGDWIELSLKHNLPSTLLLLSRAFSITSEVGAGDTKGKVLQDITDTLASLPEAVVTSAAVDEGLSHEKDDYTKKIEYLKREEEIIAQEKKETKTMQEAEKVAEAAKSEAAAIEAVAAEFAKPAEVVADKAAAETVDVTEVPMKPEAEAFVAKETTAPEKAVFAEEQATYEREKRAKRAAQLSRLLTVISDHSSVSVERQELMALVKKGLDQYEDRLEVAKESSADAAANAASPFASDAAATDVCEKEAALTNELADQVSARVDKMLQSASKEINEVEKRIGDKLRFLDADSDGKITMAELLRIREVFGDSLSETDEIDMVNILSGLMQADGSIAVEDLRKLTGDVIATERADDDVIAEEDEDDKTQSSPSPDASSSKESPPPPTSST